MRYLLLILLLLTNPAWSESKRIEVYPLSQSYWDVNTGDTLRQIVNTLMPDNAYLQERLLREIVSLNPGVFPDGDPDRMLANRRLWLPNAVKPPENNTNTSNYIIRSYQWGSIKTRR